MRRILMAVALASLVVAAAGCGGKSESEKESEGAGRGTITCDGSAFSGETGLPADFPALDGVTYVTAKKAGPTNVVDAFSDESVEGLYHEYKDRFEEAGYTIEFDELEEDDSEVAYKAKNDTEGIVAIRGGESCENGNTSVHITNRPAE